MRSSNTLRQEIVRYAHALHSRGWVANHDGNLTVRVGKGCILATPTATSKEDVSLDLLIEVNELGQKIAGSARGFSEINLHLTVLAARSDANAVLHAHCPYATALACSGSDLIETPFLPEAVVSIGASIPTLPYAQPGAQAAAALNSVVSSVDACLLANHGVLAWGATLEQAYLRMELVEHLAKIATFAQATGGVRPLPPEAFPPLLKSRARAGLGKAASGALATDQDSSTQRSPHSDIVNIVREELAKALKG